MSFETLKELYKHEDLDFSYWEAYTDMSNEMDDKHRIMKLIKVIHDIDDTLKNAKKRGY